MDNKTPENSKEHQMIEHLGTFAVLLSLNTVTPANALGPTPYQSSLDSPFATTDFDWFYIEDFEEHQLVSPGVNADHGGIASVLFPGEPVGYDSVDADDGVVDGSGAGGDSWYSGVGATGVTWTFEESVLGHLPTHAGIVWTDGAWGFTVHFEAWDAGGNLIADISGVHADHDNLSATAEDRFYGVINPGGIAMIRLSQPNTMIEMDHLQYGYAPVPAAPGAVTGMMSMVFMFMRRRTRTPKAT